MRVIAGRAKGHHLKAPPGLSTRPMADKIRGALFAMLDSLEVDYGAVLDLYAGTGAIGIEALSRGGRAADFVEINAGVGRIIAENLTHTGFSGEGRVFRRSVKQFLAGLAAAPRREVEADARPPGPIGCYDIIFLDPPYADPEIEATVVAVDASPAVHPGTVVVVGFSARRELPERLGRLQRLRLRCHGDSCFAIYVRRSDEPAEEAPATSANARGAVAEA